MKNIIKIFKKDIKKRIFIFLSVAVILFLIFMGNGIYVSQDAEHSDLKVFAIEKGEGAKKISLNLEKEGIIQSSLAFRFYALVAGKTGKLQAGKYLLSSSMPVPEIVRKITSGDTAKISITIPEGFTIKQIDRRLAEAKLIQKGELINFDSANQKSLEGFLFPDTYHFSYGMSMEEITQIMLDNFDKKLALDLQEEIEAQNKTISEIVIMASLIEKEVRTFEDKKLVSGILWKRLKIKMPLQVDATIIYITDRETAKVFKVDTKIDSPYNTYKYLGLPIGPISNPGMESILAAIYPENSEYWYYLSTPEGKTIFSRNLEEHNIAKAKYLK